MNGEHRMALTSKDRRELKARGMKLGDDLRLGKAGLSQSFIEHGRRMLSERGLVKLRFADAEGAARKELAAQVAAALRAELVAVTGRTMLLWCEPDADNHDGER